MKPNPRWKPRPITGGSDFERRLIVHTTLEGVARLLQVLGRVTVPINYATPLWQELARQIKIRDHWMCRSCGSKKTIDVHHVLPVKCGGTNLPENLKTLCRKCHRVRHPEVRKNKYVS